LATVAYLSPSAALGSVHAQRWQIYHDDGCLRVYRICTIVCDANCPTQSHNLANILHASHPRQWTLSVFTRPTDHFSGAGKAIGPVGMSACVGPPGW